MNKKLSNKHLYILLSLVIPLSLLSILALTLIRSKESNEPALNKEEIVEEIIDPRIPVTDGCDVIKGAVVLTFDDLHVDGWYKAHKEIFEPNNVRATFYLSRVSKLLQDKESLDKILEMQEFGHEMGNHSLNHLSLEGFLSENSNQDYVNQEVIEANNIANSLGLTFTSFAYPGGTGNNTDIDPILFKNFKTIRYTSGRISPTNENIFFKDACSRIITTGSIDYPEIPEEHFSLALQRAADNQEILVLLGHKLVTENEESIRYYMEYERLKFLVMEAQEKGLEFFTVSEIFKGEI